MNDMPKKHPPVPSSNLRLACAQHAEVKPKPHMHNEHAN
jgi:hypothetical protein